jgi:hypothetical protein
VMRYGSCQMAAARNSYLTEAGAPGGEGAIAM